MASRTTVNDFQPALEEVDRLLEKHEPRHKGAWLKQEIAHHIEHALGHVSEIDERIKNSGGRNLEQIQEEFASATCRMLMALTLLIERGNAS